MMHAVSAETQLNVSEGNVAGKGSIGDIRDTTEIGNVLGAPPRSKIKSYQGARVKDGHFPRHTLHGS